MSVPFSSIASSLPVVGGIVDSFVGAHTAKKNTEMTIAAQRAEAERAYQREVEMWHMQNAYNSPEEQMKRFGAAGLNPHLIYGQGNSGNATAFPRYQPPQVQYKYEAPAYGGAVASVLPTLMSVGSWMQNMRLGEEKIRGEQLANSRVEDLIDFLRARYPRDLAKLDNVLSMFPYQSSMLEANSQKAWAAWNQLLLENKFRYGVDGSSGMRGLQLIEQEAKARLRQAEASWTDFGVTNPQGLMQLVLGGVLGLAGMKVGAKRLSLNRNARPVSKPVKIGGRWMRFSK